MSSSLQGADDPAPPARPCREPPPRDSGGDRSPSPDRSQNALRVSNISAPAPGGVKQQQQQRQAERAGGRQVNRWEEEEQKEEEEERPPRETADFNIKSPNTATTRTTTAAENREPSNVTSSHTTCTKVSRAT